MSPRLWIGALGLVFVLLSCTKAQVKTGIDVGTTACKDISAVLNDGTLVALCATEAEIAAIIESALLDRKAADAGVVIGTCKPVGTGSACLTDLEIAKGIAKVLRARQALLVKDAGVNG